MKKIFTGIAAAGLGLAMFASTAAAATFTLSPWVYDPGNTGLAKSYLTSNGVRLEKNAPTAENVAAGAEVQGVEGLSTTDLTLSFDYEGYCGAGAPRFNVNLENGDTIFLGCIHGDSDNDGTATFTAGNTYGGVLFPTGETISSIDIVQDEQGQVTLSNITIGNTTITVSKNTLKDQCKKGGYQSLTDANGNTFKNQGQCVSYFTTL